MFRALLKKQLLEVNQAYFVDRKTGKRRKPVAIAGGVALAVLVYLCFAFLFVGLGSFLAEACVPLGAGWLYFTVMAAFALLIGILFTVFNSYSSLFRAKDSEMLLSMPIPPETILAVRLVTVLALALLSVAVVWVPAIIEFAAFLVESGNPVSVGNIAMQVIALVPMVLLVAVFGCLLGWVVALISGKISNKSAATTIFAVIAFGAYFWAYFTIVGDLEGFAQTILASADLIRAWGKPLLTIGQAAMGSAVSLVILLVVAVVLFAIAFIILSKTFVRIATTQATARRKQTYSSAQAKASSKKSALLRRELKRFFSIPVYTFNCGLGAIIMVLAAIVLPFQSEVITAGLGSAMAEAPVFASILPVALACGVCLVSSMDAVAAPSVSLEGKEFWIIRSLPVETAEVLEAKLRLHLLVNGLPAVLCTLSLEYTFGFTDVLVLAPVAVFAYVVVHAAYCLFIGLKKPVMEWTSPVMPVKQSIGSFFAIFGGIFASLALCGLYALVLRSLGPAEYFTAMLVVMVVLNFVLRRWIFSKGVEIFESL